MDRIIFGDNQFFGIQHASEEKQELSPFDLPKMIVL